jgi:CRISPR system Cascade subunit CasC
VFLDIHALHTLPYSNVNRDGLGSPKSCVYGGVQRIRVSSQSWKRAARIGVEREIGSPTARTRQIAVEIRKTLVEQGWDAQEARKAGRAVVYAYGLPPEDDDDATKVLLWVPRTVIADLVHLIGEHRNVLAGLPLPELDDKGKPKKLPKPEQEKRAEAIKSTVLPLVQPVTEILNRPSPTIALLGRMLADNPGHTVDGATQVAHAFTVHEVAADFDYFTAVDDFAPNSGAGHLATAEFATGTFYRYCTINISKFAAQLGDLDTALRVVEAWARTFLTVVPSGKQNSTAARTVPDLVYLAVRAAPLSLAAAFEKPVSTNGQGYVDSARNTLSGYASRVHRFIGDPGLWSGYAGTGDTELTPLGTPYDSLDDLIQAAGNTLLDNAPPEVAA